MYMYRHKGHLVCRKCQPKTTNQTYVHLQTSKAMYVFARSLLSSCLCPIASCLNLCLSNREQCKSIMLHLYSYMLIIIYIYIYIYIYNFVYQNGNTKTMVKRKVVRNEPECIFTARGPRCATNWSGA